MTRLSIVIPVYNDRDSILPTHQSLTKALEGAPFSWELLFVDDGSRDNPREILEANNLPFVQHETNKGYGAAIKTGVQNAKGEFVCIIDCDGTYPAAAILDLMKHADEYDQIVGARDVRINPPLHVFTKVIVCYLLSCLFGQNVRDINSGLRIFRREVFLQLMPGVGDRFSLTSSLTYGFLLQDIPIKYVPIEYYKRVGRSHVRRWSFTKQFCSSLTRMWRHHRRLRAQGVAVIPPERTYSARQKKESPWFERFFQLFIFLIGAALGAVWLYPQLINHYSIQDDVAQHAYWTVVYHDPELFQGDLFLDYARSLATPGFEVIYYIGTFFTNPVALGKYLGVFLFGITGWICYLVGRAYWDRITGIIMGLFFVGFPMHIDRFEAGLHRAFMYPLLAWVLLILTRKQYKYVALSLAASLLFYPPALVSGLAIILLFVVFRPSSLKEMIISRRALVGWIALALVAGITYVQRVNHKPDFLGRMTTGQEMAENPRFTYRGRSEYLPFSKIEHYYKRVFLERDNKFIRHMVFVAPLFLLVLFITGRDWTSPLLPVLAMAVTSLALFHLAKAYHFKLYIPERYVRFTATLLCASLITFAFAGILRILCKTAFLRACAATILLFVTFLRSIEPSTDFVRQEHYDISFYAPLLGEIHKLPKDALIAADPKFSDAISIYSQRKTLVKYELCHPWFLHYRALVEQRTMDFYRAVYCTNIAQLREFRDKYGVSYILVEPGLYKKGIAAESKLFYEPVESAIRYKFQSDLDKDFLLPKLADHLAISAQGAYCIVPIDEASLARFVDQMKNSV